MTDHTSLPAKLLEQAVRGENSEGMVTQSIPNPGIPPPSSLSSPPPKRPGPETGEKEIQSHRSSDASLSLAVCLGELRPLAFAAAGISSDS